MELFKIKRNGFHQNVQRRYEDLVPSFKLFFCTLAQSYYTQKMLFPAVQLMLISQQPVQNGSNFNHFFIVVIGTHLHTKLLKHCQPHLHCIITTPCKVGYI